jgi:hypothetical protein
VHVTTDSGETWSADSTFSEAGISPASGKFISALACTQDSQLRKCHVFTDWVLPPIIDSDDSRRQLAIGGARSNDTDTEARDEEQLKTEKMGKTENIKRTTKMKKTGKMGGKMGGQMGNGNAAVEKLKTGNLKTGKVVNVADSSSAGTSGVARSVDSTMRELLITETPNSTPVANATRSDSVHRRRLQTQMTADESQEVSATVSRRRLQTQMSVEESQDVMRALTNLPKR